MDRLSFIHVFKGLDPEHNQAIIKRVREDFNADVSAYECIEDLFPLLSDPFFHPDYIFIDIESFYDVDDTDVFEIIQTLNTLIKCTVSKRNLHTKPAKRTTRIVALVSSNTPINLVKEILKFPAISSVLGRASPGFTYEDCVKDCKLMLEGRMGAGSLIINMLKKPRPIKPIVKNEISLTPRQQQIMDLICSKGASNKIIARTLAISESTVKLHVGHIFKKYGVRSRTQLAVFNRK